MKTRNCNSVTKRSHDLVILVVFIHFIFYQRLNKFALFVGFVSAFELMLVGGFTDLYIIPDFITMVTG